MKKTIVCLLALSGAALFAGTFDGTTDETLTKSIISEAAALKDGPLLNFAGMLLAADPALSAMTPEALRAALSGKTPAAVEAIAKEKSAADYAMSAFFEERFPPEAKQRIVAELRKYLETAKPESPAKFIDGFAAAMAGLNAAEYRKLMRDVVNNTSDDRIVAFFIAYSLTAEDDKLAALERVKLYLAPDGRAKTIDYAQKHYPDYSAIMTEAEKMIAKNGREAVVNEARNTLAAQFAEPPVHAEIPWTTDFAAARKLAEKENKLMFVLFTGSDWCPWCVKLDKQLLATREFVDFAKDNYVLVYVDFPNKPLPPAQAEANRALSKKYGVSGFPTILLMSPDGAVVGRTGYENVTVTSFINSLRELAQKKK